MRDSLRSFRARRHLSGGSFAIVLGLVASGSLWAATWRSELYSDSWDSTHPETISFETDKLIQDFSYAGYRSGKEPIPEVTGPVTVDVTQPPYQADPTGAVDATAAIQAAIDHVGSRGGGVVFLPAGTYRLSVPADRTEALLIARSGVVVRGAGRDQTFLLNHTYAPMAFKAVIRVRGAGATRFYADGPVQSPITTDLLRPTRVIPVADVTPFKAGDTVVLRADMTDQWVREHGEPSWVGQQDSLPGVAFRREVIAINADDSSLLVDIPIRYYLKTRDAARVHRVNVRPESQIGLEEFSIGNRQHPGEIWGNLDYSTSGTPAADVNSCHLIMFERVTDSWIRRVSSYQAPENTSTCHLLSGGISLRETTRVTVEECVMQRPQYGGGGGNGYMFRLVNTSDNLVINCEARWSRHGFLITSMGSSGNVIHACLDADTGLSTGSTGRQLVNGRASDHHGSFSASNLIDVCIGENSWWDALYRDLGRTPNPALTTAHSVYWNLEGRGSGNQAIVRSEQARYGYVIGTRGSRSRVELPRIAPAATDPIDHVEGVGEGDTLEPFSLYRDQLARRFGSAVQLPPSSE
jgi:hypothetical protein